VQNVEDLFHTIDQNGSGQIDFQEFLNFFETILRSPSLLSSGSRHATPQHL
jgi:Ca2+-binding EF-hand superfamily protein